MILNTRAYDQKCFTYHVHSPLMNAHVWKVSSRRLLFSHILFNKSTHAFSSTQLAIWMYNGRSLRVICVRATWIREIKLVWVMSWASEQEIIISTCNTICKFHHFANVVNQHGAQARVRRGKYEERRSQKICTNIEKAICWNKKEFECYEVRMAKY